MTTYTVQGPSGRTYEIEGPEGATSDQLGQFILSQNKDERIAMTRAQMAKEFDPTKGMGVVEKLRAGIGKGMTDLARGAGQWVGAVDRADVGESRRLDSALMKTGAGQAGNFIGQAVPITAASMLIPGSGTVLGAGGVGAGAGALQPSESTTETASNIGLGAILGAGGQKLGNMGADFAKNRAAQKAAEFAAGQAANSQKLGVAREASKAGFVIPPSDIQPQGALMEAAAGLSGKIKTAQTASARNQAVVDEMARKALGLPKGAELSREALTTIRQQAGTAYDQFKGFGQVVADKSYSDALDKIASASKGAARSFPGLKADKVDDLVQTMRQQSFDASDAIDATKVLRELADGAYSQGDKQLGKAYKAVSNALEDVIDRNLAATAPEAVKQFRDARQLIAKTYSIERALNGQTGEVSAQALAAQLKRGKPLSGELKTIAQVAEAFPKATQTLRESPKQLSPLDFGAAGVGLAGSGGNPLAAAGLLVRPATRAVLLSPALQRAALADMAAPTSRLAGIASNPLSRLVYGPAAVAGVNSRQ